MFARISRSTSWLARRLPGDAAAPPKAQFCDKATQHHATVKQSLQREFISPYFLLAAPQSAGGYRRTAWRVSFRDLFRSGLPAADFHRMAGSPDGPQDAQGQRAVAGLYTRKTRRDWHRRLSAHRPGRKIGIESAVRCRADRRFRSAARTVWILPVPALGALDSIAWWSQVRITGGCAISVPCRNYFMSMWMKKLFSE